MRWHVKTSKSVLPQLRDVRKHIALVRCGLDRRQMRYRSFCHGQFGGELKPTFVILVLELLVHSQRQRVLFVLGFAFFGELGREQRLFHGLILRQDIKTGATNFVTCSVHAIFFLHLYRGASGSSFFRDPC